MASMGSEGGLLAQLGLCPLQVREPAQGSQPTCPIPWAAAPGPLSSMPTKVRAADAGSPQEGRRNGGDCREMGTPRDGWEPFPLASPMGLSCQHPTHLGVLMSARSGAGVSEGARTTRTSC